MLGARASISALRVQRPDLAIPRMLESWPRPSEKLARTGSTSNTRLRSHVRFIRRQIQVRQRCGRKAAQSIRGAQNILAKLLQSLLGREHSKSHASMTNKL